MKTTLQAYLSGAYWKHGFSWSRLAAASLGALGAIWLVAEILQFIEVFPRAVQWLKEKWWLFFVGGAVWGMWVNRPQLAVEATLKTRDVRIQVRVGNIFDGDASIVIPCNTSFDTDVRSGIINPTTIQGQFTEKYYAEVAHLDAELTAALARPYIPAPQINAQKVGKQHVYPIGTTIKLRPKGRTAYLCAIANMNAQGNAHATFDDLKSALPELWDQITTSGDHGDIAVPMLGSGLARIAVAREVLVREILQSFIAACAAQRPCASLAVVIHPKEYFRLGMNLEELGAFLTHLCKYTDFALPSAAGGGQPMPPDALMAPQQTAATRP